MPLADDFLPFNPAELQTRLQIRRIIGKGGFACVYKAIFDDKVVALKVLRPEFCKRESTDLKMFLREGQYLKRCRHRHIVGCKGLCQLPPDFPGLEGNYTTLTWAMILDYVEGGPISKLVAKQFNNPGNLLYTEQQAFQWCLEIAESLSYLHSTVPQVIHRDVKLGNVLLAVNKDGKMECKLADFGLHVKVNTGEHKMLRRKSFVQGSTPQPSEELFYAVDRHGVAVNLASRTASPAASRLPSMTDHGRSRMSNATYNDPSKRGADGAMLDESLAAIRAHSRSTRKDPSTQPAPMLLPNQVSAPSGRPSLSGSVENHMPAGVSEAPSALSTAQRQGLASMKTVSDLGVGPTFTPEAVQKSPLSFSPVRTSGFSVTNGKLMEDASHSPYQPTPRSQSIIKQRRPPAHPVHATASMTIKSARVQFSVNDVAKNGRAEMQEGPADQQVANLRSMSMVSTGSDLLEGIPEICVLDRQKSVFRMMRSAVSPEFEREFQWVFNLTGRTGSHMYMAPEVYKMLPYNDKVDVFSLGVVIYEVFSQSMLSFTHLPPRGTRFANSNDFALNVSNGYRPSRPRKIPDELWLLVMSCWHEDPVQRPSMSQVVDRMTRLKAIFYPDEPVGPMKALPAPEEEGSKEEAKAEEAGGCRCVIA